MYEKLIKEFLESGEAAPYLEDETKLPQCLGAFMGRRWKSFTIPPLDALIAEVRRQRAPGAICKNSTTWEHQRLERVGKNADKPEQCVLCNKLRTDIEQIK